MLESKIPKEPRDGSLQQEMNVVRFRLKERKVAGPKRLSDDLLLAYKRKFSQNVEAKVNVASPEAQPLSISCISVTKRCALRRGIWFRALSRIERGVLDLTVRYVGVIRSATLANVVTAILNKLKLAIVSKVDRLVKTVGFSLARKVSVLAQGWGNRSAFSWAENAGFARYLAVTHMNANRLI